MSKRGDYTLIPPIFRTACFWSGFLFFPLWQLRQEGNVDLLPHLLFNALTLWEVLFVYGWLQLRFERAFGFVFAPVLAGLCFAVYHLGSFPLTEIPMLLGVGFLRHCLCLYT